MWLNVIAPVYLAGRADAMREAGVNVPKGKNYNRHLDEWAKRIGFDLKLIDEHTRVTLAHLTEHRAEFDEWWTARTTNERQEWAHPRTLWSKLKRYLASKTGTSDSHGAEKKKKKKKKKKKHETDQERIETLNTELNMAKADLAKARDGQLLIDLSRNTTDRIVRTIRNDPACLANPRYFAEVFRRVAFVLQQDANEGRKAEPIIDVQASQSRKSKGRRKSKRDGQEARP